MAVSRAGWISVHSARPGPQEAWEAWRCLERFAVLLSGRSVPSGLYIACGKSRRRRRQQRVIPPPPPFCRFHQQRDKRGRNVDNSRKHM